MGNDSNQFELVEAIVRYAISVVDPGWIEIVMNYSVDETQSDFLNSYLAGEGGRVVEKALAYSDGLEGLFTRLREHLAQLGGDLFSTCWIQVSNDGRYQTKYGYEPVDWDALTEVSSNFA